ncbi:MAG: DUF885 domain-containing protein [Candidatus Eiseniibacteriota bacterium]
MSARSLTFASHRVAFVLAMAGALGLGLGAAQPAAAQSPAERLSNLSEEYWQGLMKVAPTWATNLGDRRYDDKLSDISPAGEAAELARRKDVLARAQAIDPAGLSPRDRVTRGLLIEECETYIATEVCNFEEWVVDPLGGPQTDFLNLADLTPIRNQKEAEDFVKRVRAMGPYLDQHIANLTRGLRAGRTASVDPVNKTIGQLDRLADLPVNDWTFFDAVRKPGATGSRADSTKMEKALTEAVSEVLKPAFGRYRTFLREQVLPAARPQEKAGLASLPGGVECYRPLIRSHTSLDLSPQELHDLGKSEVARFRRDLAELGMKVFGTSDVAEIQRKLRTDPAMHFKTADEIETKARDALAKAQAATPKWFGIVPQAPCIVKPMGMHEAPQSTIAYYQQPATDGSRPGTYMINTYKPETRPRYEAEALAFHEAVPGHHLQIAIAQELKDLPTFRKFTGTTAYVEGWGLYGERLADEMGLYSGDIDRMGILSYDAWRACRLVVDTGLHAFGWTRQQAIDYMTENTVLAPNNIVNEVDRYITWPGQALAYKVGQLEILKLRAEAKNKLGDRFDIRGFHDAVLSQGAVTLPVLRNQVETWAAGVQAGAAKAQ